MFILLIVALNCLSVCDIPGVKGENGGQDLFTSLAQLEVLWHNDIEVVKQMEEAIRKMETTINTFKS